MIMVHEDPHEPVPPASRLGALKHDMKGKGYEYCMNFCAWLKVSDILLVTYYDLEIPQNNLCNIDQNTFCVFTSSVVHSPEWPTEEVNTRSLMDGAVGVDNICLVFSVELSQLKILTFWAQIAHQKHILSS